jgi:hypothetical protein
VKTFICFGTFFKGERVRHFPALNAGHDGRIIEWHGTLKELAAELGLTHGALDHTLAALKVPMRARY